MEIDISVTYFLSSIFPIKSSKNTDYVFCVIFDGENPLNWDFLMKDDN